MKTIADPSKDAGSLLTELFDFKNTAQGLVRAAGPYTKYANGRPLPKFVAETSAEMRKLLVKNFRTVFPFWSGLVEDGLGSSDAGFQRIHDACYQFNEAQRVLVSKNCVLMTDNDRRSVCDQLNQAIGDVVVFILIHFDFTSIREEKGVMLCVQSYCEAHGITPEVLYALLLQDLDDAEQSWYSYEPISPMYRILQEFDSVFMEECSTCNFKLYDNMTERLVSGELDIAAVRGACLEGASASQEREGNMTPSSLISAMNLDGN